MHRNNSKIAVYARSTDGVESLRVPMLNCIDIASDILDDDNIEHGTATELIDFAAKNGVSMTSPGVITYIDSDGEKTGYDDVMSLLANPDSSLQHIIVPATGDGEVSSIVTTALRNDVTCHVIPGDCSDVGDSMSDVMSRRAGVGEAWSGRPPLGFAVEAGHLVKADDYGEVVAVLKLVDVGKLSKRSAADELDTSRRTVGRCLDSPERYGLAD